MFMLPPQAGYNLDSLMVRYQGIDWRDPVYWSCNARCPTLCCMRSSKLRVSYTRAMRAAACMVSACREAATGRLLEAALGSMRVCCTDKRMCLVTRENPYKEASLDGTSLTPTEVLFVKVHCSTE
jgi:hypothetical protein